MRPIDQLALLQALDSRLDADRQRYAEIQNALREPTTLLQARKEHGEAAARMEHWGRERRQRETAVADQQARIKAQEQQLYGSRIKDPREQVALQKNVEALKRRLGDLEEAALEAMLELEQSQADMRNAETLLAAATAAWQKQQAELEAERQNVIARARTTKMQRESTAASLPPALCKRYDDLRQKRGGVAVAPVTSEGCGGCGAALPTAVRQQTHGDELAPCPICGRLLHAA